ncbi:MAG: hypothetical protein AAGA48_02175 [Myxococcota bacterium]
MRTVDSGEINNGPRNYIHWGVDDEGVMEMTIDATGPGPSGTELFTEAMETAGEVPRAIRGNWAYGDNLAEFNMLTDPQQGRLAPIDMVPGRQDEPESSAIEHQLSILMHWWVNLGATPRWRCCMSSSSVLSESDQKELDDCIFRNDKLKESA